MHKFYLLFFVLLLFGNVLKAQNRTISGTVTDEKSEPLPGATIQIKGSKAGTTTDVNGKYSLKVTNLQNVVVGVKFLGYDYQEKTVMVGELNADFKLVRSSSDLSEVVVVGYGTQRKLTLTGSVATVDVKKIEDNPVLNLATALAGTMPGVSVSGGTQRPGQPTAITIRNPVAYAKDGPIGTTPLYVIDDVIRSPADFNLLDPSLVENISVLKDAEAAIYGIQGANGVVVVRTKRGKSGPPKINFSTSLSTEGARQLPKMMSGSQLATWSNDYYQEQAAQATHIDPASGATVPNFYDANGYLNGVITNGRLANWFTPDELSYFSQPGNNQNFLKQFFHSAVAQREAINVSGGSDKVTYFVGADYVNQNSNFSGVNSNKLGLRASIDAKPAKGLTTSLSLSDDIAYTRSFWYKFAGENLDNDVTSLVQAQPWQKYFINGQPVFISNTSLENTNVGLIENSNNYTGGTNYIMNILAKINYEIPGVKGLSVGVAYNDNIDNAFNKQYGTAFTYYKYTGSGDNHHIPGGTVTGTQNISNGDRVRLTPNYATNYQLDATINYNRTFGKHSINLIGIYEQRELYAEGVAAEADGVIVTGQDNQNFTTGAQSSNQASAISQSGFLAYIGRLNYSYANKYLLQLSMRADGSSRFTAGHNYGYFPAASVGWIASDEKFVKDNLGFFDLLKFRASAGLTGSDNTKAYQNVLSYKYGTGSSGGAVFNEAPRGLGILPNLVVANTGINWDHTFKTDYGVDMEFLDHRLSGTAEYYWNHGYDLLTAISASIPTTIGAATGNLPSENYDVVNTFGWEISAGWRDRIGKDFSYNFSPFFTWSDDKIVRYDLDAGLRGTFRDATGRSDDLGILGYQYIGMIRTPADAAAVIAQRQAAAGGAANVKIGGLPVQPGMLNYQDLNGDGVIDDKDLKYLTNKAGNHYGLGLNWGAAYKGISLNVVMGLSWGGQGAIAGTDIKTSDVLQNKPIFWADHWTPQNTNAKYPNPYFVSDYNMDFPSNFWFVSSFQWNITSANLSYTLPSKWAGKIGINSARLFVVGNNLLNLSNPYPYSYRDPSSTTIGYPSLRQITFGINVGI